MEYGERIILFVYCALGFGPGRFYVSKRAVHARGVRVLHIFAPLRAQGSGFFRFCALTRAGDFKFFQVFAPLCGPLRGDFRAFPAGRNTFPALPAKAGFPALCRAMLALQSLCHVLQTVAQRVDSRRCVHFLSFSFFLRLRATIISMNILMSSMSSCVNSFFASPYAAKS